MARIVLITDAWGPKFGGINALNTDLAKALGVLLTPTTEVLCVVLKAEPEDVEDARRSNVHLLSIGASRDHGLFEVSRATDVVNAVGKADGATWWVGHDIITGELAVSLPGAAGFGRSAVIHHMSYIDYQSYKHGAGQEAKKKYDRQKHIFKAADHVFGVGPLLYDRVLDFPGCSEQKVSMLIPGLAEIEPQPLPRTFNGMVFGRLDPENDRIKQGRLAIAGFATACKKASSPGGPAALQGARLHVIGIPEPGGEEEQSLRRFAAEKAGRVLMLVPLPYDDSRASVFESLARASVAMMLSWHEGFGLTGWEAVAAQVPLVVSRGTGVYQLVDQKLGGAGLGCLEVIDVRGQEEGEGEDNFQQQDEDEVAAALLSIAAAPERAKQDARMLHELLKERCGFTWTNAARSVAEALAIALPERTPAPLPACIPATDTPDSVPAEATPPQLDDLLELREPRWQPGCGLAESQLLRAEERSVPFHPSRRPLLEEVLHWAQADSQPAVALQLRIGSGGAGKTRLMLEACHELEAAGWRAGFLQSGANQDLSRRAANLIGISPRLLIVVDYAEARRQEVIELVRAALNAPPENRVRIMLLARTAGDWWDHLPEDHPAIDGFLTGGAVTGPYPLTPVRLEGTEREEVFREALAAFAERLHRDSAGCPVPDLSEPHFGQVLFIHLSALATLFGEQPDTVTGLLDATLRREHRYWHQAAADAELRPLVADGVDQTMALITLAGGTRSAGSTRALVAAAPILHHCTDAEKQTVFRLLGAFYPLRGGIDALRPDLLGERLVVKELIKDDELLDVVLCAGADEQVARSALTVLTRMARTNATDEEWLRRGLERHLEAQAQSAVDIAIEIGDPIGRIMAAVLEQSPKGRQHQVAMHLNLPRATVSLRELALVAARVRVNRLADKGRPRGQKAVVQLFKAYLELGKRLGDVGNHEEAVDACRRALELLQTRARRDWQTEAMAASAEGNLAVNLRNIGSYENALVYAEKVYVTFRNLAAARPDAFRANLAVSLNTFANRLSELGRYEEALTRAQEAYDLYEELAAAQPDAFRANLAGSLQNLANRLGELGRYEKALERAQEAYDIYEELAAARPDAFRANLAASLNTLANYLGDLGRYKEALTRTEEAYDIFEELAAARPDAFRAELAGLLNNLANRLDDLGRYEEALERAQEAYDIYEELAAARPDAFRAELAMSLNNFATCLSDLGRYEEALARTQEAYGIYEGLAAARPNVFSTDVAMSLSNLACHLSDLGRYGDAVARAKEAHTISAELEQIRPMVSHELTAGTGANYAHALIRHGRAAEAAKLARASTTRYEQLRAGPRGGVVAPEFAGCLAILAEALLITGEHDTALRHSRDACDIWSSVLESRSGLFEDRVAFAWAIRARCEEASGERAELHQSAGRGLRHFEADLARRPRPLTPHMSEVQGHLLRLIEPIS
ncbi:tetratricopeptide repeat protein [Thiohalomonas denitrificans]|uniref:Glycosyltransferase involved in cell wall bisynthesis n=1 Tax=Thiohalomonas denitrificans TaxID=415747 RepID=A0A1G5PTR0_9GAMM|nr:tetratricopeptide repeat protein [Thiohalomonas denitrificans]SCZ52913.1 Glycosyltransferase involved in cell wall bisynthesis [Thiohalomonas denitrificans]